MSLALDGNAIERAASELGHALGIGRERAKAVISGVVNEMGRNRFLRSLSRSRSVVQMSAAIENASAEDLEFSPSFRHTMGRSLTGIAVGNWINLVGIALGTLIAVEIGGALGMSLGVVVCVVMFAMAARQAGTSLEGILKELLESIKAKIMSFDSN